MESYGMTSQPLWSISWNRERWVGVTEKPSIGWAWAGMGEDWWGQRWQSLENGIYKNLYLWPSNCQRSGNLEETHIMGAKLLVTSKLHLHRQQLFCAMPYIGKKTPNPKPKPHSKLQCKNVIFLSQKHLGVTWASRQLWAYLLCLRRTQGWSSRWGTENCHQDVMLW